jgi:hypothetical protein
MKMMTTTMIEKSVVRVIVVAMNDAKKCVAKVNAEKVIIGSPKAALPKVDDHSPDVQKLIVLKLIVLTVPDVIRAPASTNRSQNTKGRLIRGRQNMESSHRLRMVRRARVDFILR